MQLQPSVATKDTPDAVVLIATAWGPKHGGINAFNKDLAVALATHVGVPVLCFVSLPEAADIAAARGEKVTLLTIPAACPDRVDALATFAQACGTISHSPPDDDIPSS
jgi:hypothetical protein